MTKKSHQTAPWQELQRGHFQTGEAVPHLEQQLLLIPAWNSIIYVELLGRWYCFQVQQNHQTMALTRSTYEKKTKGIVEGERFVI